MARGATVYMPLNVGFEPASTFQVHRPQTGWGAACVAKVDVQLNVKGARAVAPMAANVGAAPVSSSRAVAYQYVEVTDAV